MERLGTPEAHAQQVRMTVDTTDIAIGEPTVLRVQADRDVTAGSGSFEWPAWQDTIPGGLEILQVLGADTTAIEGEAGNPIIRVERAYEITAWDSGYLAIPPALLVWGTDTIASNPLLLNVLLAPPGEPGQIAGHADIRRFVVVAGATAALVALVLGLGRCTRTGVLLHAVVAQSSCCGGRRTHTCSPTRTRAHRGPS